jgi:hypothetical protein
MKMKTVAAFALTCLSLFSATSSALAASEPTLESLATCQDSWLDWKDNPAPGKKFTEMLRTGYTADSEDGHLVPKAKTTLLGLPVKSVYPDSVGMGVGFSVGVSADFASAKKAVEKAIGKPLKCEADSAEIRACEAELGPKRNVTVASEPGNDKYVLIGCFYFYEK